MASTIFTYDHDPPKVASPWPSSAVGPVPIEETIIEQLRFDESAQKLGDYGVENLEPEPQEGPVEYKLHLLLRPRSKIIDPRSRSPKTSTEPSQQTSLSVQQRPRHISSPIVAAQSSEPRQERLLHLTTQLLWRLQQSSPLHLTAQSFSDRSVSGAKSSRSEDEQKTVSLAPSLNHSQGALYEIGVSDDGALEGLNESEMRESLLTLQSMAISLGCGVVVRRLIRVNQTVKSVGVEEAQRTDSVVHQPMLWVAEAFVRPGLASPTDAKFVSADSIASSEFVRPMGDVGTELEDRFAESFEAEQLRISLTGSSTSGKSSLLGTLSTSTLDNGRGRSRLGLLKHRHEISSGVTSSIVTEVIGYPKHSNAIVNCSMPDIKSWADIHAACVVGRIVSLSDTAGHPRFRRTTIRGLVALKPHWTLCCVAADDHGDVAASDQTSPSASDVSRTSSPRLPVQAHLELCLTLDIPIIVVITKMDTASTMSLRKTLNCILTMLKTARRQPIVLASSAQATSESGPSHCLTLHDIEESRRVLTPGSPRQTAIVPIVLTSALTGRGIGTLHALLREIPIIRSNDTGSLPPRAPTSISSQTVFNIDEVFGASSSDTITLHDGRHALEGFILSGYTSNGILTVGDELLLGPLSPRTITPATNGTRGPINPISVPISEGELNPPGLDGERALSHNELSPVQPHIALHDALWCTVRVISLRDLRQPHRRVTADRFVTAGVVLADASSQIDVSKLRKGMVMISKPPRDNLENKSLACRGFTARLAQEDMRKIPPGISVTVYVSTLRAPAIIIDDGPTSTDGTDVGFRLITFTFVNYLEFVKLGDKALIVPDTAEKGSVGLEGIVGHIVGRIL